MAILSGHLWRSGGDSVVNELSFKSETTQDFKFQSLFLRGTQLPLDIFHLGKWKLGECVSSHIRYELFECIDTNKSY